MSNTFLPGDVVVLRSGGPQMTVRGQGSDNTDFIACFYFDGSRLVVGEIPPQALIKAERTLP